MQTKSKKILIFVHDIYEDLELQYPKYRLIEAGFEVVVAGPESNVVYKGKHGYPCTPNVAIRELQVNDFDGVVIPGGFAPDKLRMDPKVLEITKGLFDQGKMIAFICHAGWVPISAKILKGIRCTSYRGIKDDMVNAGANWVDEAVVVDRNVISSRRPDDLPVFCQAMLKFLNNAS